MIVPVQGSPDSAIAADYLDYDVLIVRVGFGGFYALHKLRGAGFQSHLLEAASGAGDTLFSNRCPGACRDVKSRQYSQRNFRRIGSGRSDTHRSQKFVDIGNMPPSFRPWEGYYRQYHRLSADYNEGRFLYGRSGVTRRRWVTTPEILPFGVAA